LPAARCVGTSHQSQAHARNDACPGGLAHVCLWCPLLLGHAGDALINVDGRAPAVHARRPEVAPAKKREATEAHTQLNPVFLRPHASRRTPCPPQPDSAHKHSGAPRPFTSPPRAPHACLQLPGSSSTQLLDSQPRPHAACHTGPATSPWSTDPSPCWEPALTFHPTVQWHMLLLPPNCTCCSFT
jgi:hypothetical protein